MNASVAATPPRPLPTPPQPTGGPPGTPGVATAAAQATSTTGAAQATLPQASQPPAATQPPDLTNVKENLHKLAESRKPGGEWLATKFFDKIKKSLPDIINGFKDTFAQKDCLIATVFLLLIGVTEVAFLVLAAFYLVLLTANLLVLGVEAAVRGIKFLATQGSERWTENKILKELGKPGKRDELQKLLEQELKQIEGIEEQGRLERLQAIEKNKKENQAEFEKLTKENQDQQLPHHQRAYNQKELSRLEKDNADLALEEKKLQEAPAFFQATQKQIKENREGIAKHEEAIKQAGNRLSPLLKTLDEKEQASAKVDEEMKRLKRKSSTYQSDLQAKQKEKADRDGEIQELNNQVDPLNKQIEDEEKNKANLEDEIKKLQAAETKQKYDILSKTLDEQGEELREQKEKIESALLALNQAVKASTDLDKAKIAILANAFSSGVTEEIRKQKLVGAPRRRPPP
jgi:hypothetical protein